MEIISILIAFVSLCISFVSLLISRGVAPVIHKSGIDVTVHGDGIDLLFAECDTPCDDFNNPDICHACDKLNVRNKQIVRMVNKNNRDILVFLQAGYVCNDNRKYHIKPEYFKLMANRRGANRRPGTGKAGKKGRHCMRLHGKAGQRRQIQRDHKL